MKWVVDVKEISYGRIVVEAKDKDEAQQLAEDAVGQGMVDWGKMEVTTENPVPQEEK